MSHPPLQFQVGAALTADMAGVLENGTSTCGRVPLPVLAEVPGMFAQGAVHRVEHAGRVQTWVCMELMGVGLGECISSQVCARNRVCR